MNELRSVPTARSSKRRFSFETGELKPVSS
jgi:hypothetical protein